ncbi:MAG: hypothetical protein RL518_1569 [Pseudomonadota bacterium]|jgi:hypothetical protein
MSYHPRIECKNIASFQTTRSRKSKLWLVNNDQLEEAILGYAARYTTRHEVKMYALAIEGNHIQNVCMFPRANRSHFMRDFNSAVARAVARFQHSYPGGPFWHRRYSAEYLVACPDIEDRFFYTVLQPVNDGLVDDIRDYPGYNCFEDAITGRKRTCKVVKWKEYNDARRWNRSVSIEQFTELCTLKYERLPGYDHLSSKEYETMMRRKLKERTKAVLEVRKAKHSLGPVRLKEIKPGATPKKTKTSGRFDYRPRVLSKDPERLALGEAWYFSIYFHYKNCSARYRAGELTVEFPPGTYKPPLFTVGRCGLIT